MCCINSHSLTHIYINLGSREGGGGLINYMFYAVFDRTYHLHAVSFF